MAQAGKWHIDPQEMTELVSRGVARPLMAGYAAYVPASAEQHQVFDDLAHRLALADAAVAHTRDGDPLP